MVIEAPLNFCPDDHHVFEFNILMGEQEMFRMDNRVSQKTQKSEFWNVTYPSGFHRLDEPPEKNSAL